MSKKDKKYLDLMIELAQDVEPIRGSRHAACIVNGKDIISTGTNKMKTHPLQREYSASYDLVETPDGTMHKNPKSLYLHAEIDAIREALRVLDDPDYLLICTMYVARALADGSPAIAKPCRGCQEAIKAFGLRRVRWTS